MQRSRQLAVGHGQQWLDAPQLRYGGAGQAPAVGDAEQRQRVAVAQRADALVIDVPAVGQVQALEGWKQC